MVCSNTFRRDLTLLASLIISLIYQCCLSNISVVKIPSTSASNLNLSCNKKNDLLFCSLKYIPCNYENNGTMESNLWMSVFVWHKKINWRKFWYTFPVITSRLQQASHEICPLRNSDTRLISNSNVHSKDLVLSVFSVLQYSSFYTKRLLVT